MQSSNRFGDVCGTPASGVSHLIPLVDATGGRLIPRRGGIGGRIEELEGNPRKGSNGEFFLVPDSIFESRQKAVIRTPQYEPPWASSMDGKMRVL